MTRHPRFKTGLHYPDPDPALVTTIRLPEAVVAELDLQLPKLKMLYPDARQRAAKRLEIMDAALRASEQGQAFLGALAAIHSADATQNNALLLRGLHFKNEEARHEFYEGVQQYLGVDPEGLEHEPEPKDTRRELRERDRIHHDTSGDCVGSAVILHGRSIRANPYPTLVLTADQFLRVAAAKLPQFRAGLSDTQAMRETQYGEPGSLLLDGLDYIAKHFPEIYQDELTVLQSEWRTNPEQWLHHELAQLPKQTQEKGALSHALVHQPQLGQRPMLDWDMEEIRINIAKPPTPDMDEDHVRFYTRELYLKALLEYTACDHSIAKPVWIPQDGALIVNNRTMLHGRGDAMGPYVERAQAGDPTLRRTMGRYILPPIDPARTFTQDELARAGEAITGAYRG